MSEIDVRQMNTTALAYMGDAVYEIYVRKHVIESGKYHVDNLHKSAIMYVKASAQAKVMRALMKGADENGEGSFLTADEYALAKRARNHKIASKAKNADPIDYKNATAFEALIGYLYLSGNIDRTEEIILKAFEITARR